MAGDGPNATLAQTPVARKVVSVSEDQNVIVSKRQEIRACLQRSDVDAARSIFASQELIQQRPGFAGGTWLFYAAEVSGPDMLSALVSLGFDPNDESDSVGDKPICRAAQSGRADNVQRLLELGTVLDTRASVRNPLFAAIIGRTFESARLLLASGIDASVRYNSETMSDMDAIAFALWRGQTDIALLIAGHLASGDEIKTQTFLREARQVVRRNAPLEYVRIVPTLEDLQRE